VAGFFTTPEDNCRKVYGIPFPRSGGSHGPRGRSPRSGATSSPDQGGRRTPAAAPSLTGELAEGTTLPEAQTAAKFGVSRVSWSAKPWSSWNARVWSSSKPTAARPSGPFTDEDESEILSLRATPADDGGANRGHEAERTPTSPVSKRSWPARKRRGDLTDFSALDTALPQRDRRDRESSPPHASCGWISARRWSCGSHGCTASGKKLIHDVRKATLGVAQGDDRGPQDPQPPRRPGT